MEDTRRDAGPAEQGPSNVNVSWWPSDFVEKFGSVSLDSQDETVNHKESMRHFDSDVLSPLKASQILWHTGMLSEPIPNGFYSVIPETRLKELFHSIPTLDELHALGVEGSRADIILVDSDKDKKLSMVKQLIVTLVKGLSSNPAAIIKKIAVVVSDFYKRPSMESPAKSALDETSHMFENRGVQMLGQIKHGSCRPRAILFKVLADAVGLESRLMVGLPNDGAIECVDSYKHMSVIVELNSVEMLVDLMRFPGQLLPTSTKAVLMTHISAAGESDSAENDSCDSPLEPNSPLFGVSESAEKEENLQFHRKFEVSSNVTGLSLRNMMLRSNSSLSLSHSEPNIASAFGRRSRKKVIAEQRTASSSPEHPSFRARGRSMLSGDNRTAFTDFADDQATSSKFTSKQDQIQKHLGTTINLTISSPISDVMLIPVRILRTSDKDAPPDLKSSFRSGGASPSEVRRIRRRSISITPEIGDDIVRAVRAMNETLKQNRLMRERGDDNSFSHSPNNSSSDTNVQKNVRDSHDERSTLYSQHDQVTSQKAMSLPSSPHDYRGQTSERSVTSRYGVNDEMESTWNKVLESPMFNNKPLLPYEEWNIDFSELTVGTRVGIGFFGEVFRGVWNGTDVAIKVFLEQDLTAENMEDFCNEISILSRLRHPNVILFLGACTKPPRLSMVTEYMEMGSLYYLIHLSGQKKKLSWRRKIKMLRDICKGLMCIHRMKIVHRDLKSANCLVNKHWTVKICDFGLSRIMIESPMRDSSSAGTPEWMAPELIRNEPFTEKCDIFSLGVIMWELCTLSRPWEGIPPERVVYSVANESSRLEIPDPEGPLGRLISDCWAESHERPSCDEILSRLAGMEYSLC